MLIIWISCYIAAHNIINVAFFFCCSLSVLAPLSVTIPSLDHQVHLSCFSFFIFEKCYCSHFIPFWYHSRLHVAHLPYLQHDLQLFTEPPQWRIWGREELVCSFIFVWYCWIERFYATYVPLTTTALKSPSYFIKYEARTSIYMTCTMTKLQHVTGQAK